MLGVLSQKLTYVKRAGPCQLNFLREEGPLFHGALHSVAQKLCLQFALKMLPFKNGQNC